GRNTRSYRDRRGQNGRCDDRSLRAGVQEAKQNQNRGNWFHGASLRRSYSIVYSNQGAAVPYSEKTIFANAHAACAASKFSRLLKIIITVSSSGKRINSV